jgi:carboxylesterase type B
MPDAHATAHGNVAAHRNIVYATAERFGPPVRVTTERVVATAVQCPQVPGLLEQAMGTGSVAMNEDCLTLNVFAPTSSAPVKPNAPSR